MPAPSRSAAEALRPLLASDAFGQLLRFAVAGLGVTALSVLVYLFATTALHVPPLAANAISHGTGIAAGYAVHSRWSFRADGREGGAVLVRFAIVSALAFAMNSLWVWLATHALGLPAWTPVPAMLFVTPLASFALNRWWVFA